MTSATQGLVASGGLLLVNSTPVPAQVTASKAQAAVSVSGPGFSLRLQGLRADGRAAPLSAAGSLEVVQGQQLRANGAGFAAATFARVFIFQSSQLAAQAGESYVIDLGSIPVDSSGNFLGTLPIPPTLPAGRYTAQVNGYAPDLSVRSVSLPLTLRKAGAATKRVTATITFDPLSTRITPKAQRVLRALARRIPKNARGIFMQSVGYVQPTTRQSNDDQLSTARARNAAQAMRRLGIQARTYAVGRGRSTLPGGKGRRVNLTITYRISN